MTVKLLGSTYLGPDLIRPSISDGQRGSWGGLRPRLLGPPRLGRLRPPGLLSRLRLGLPPGSLLRPSLRPLLLLPRLLLPPAAACRPRFILGAALRLRPSPISCSCEKAYFSCNPDSQTFYRIIYDNYLLNHLTVSVGPSGKRHSPMMECNEWWKKLSNSCNFLIFFNNLVSSSMNEWKKSHTVYQNHQSTNI